MRAPTVNGPDQPPKRYLGSQKTNTLVSSRFPGLKVHEQENAGNDLNDKKEHRDPAEVVPPHPVRAYRYLLVPQELEQWRKLITPIQPAEQTSALRLAFYVKLVVQKLQCFRQVAVELHTSPAAGAVARTTRVHSYQSGRRDRDTKELTDQADT